MAISITTAMPTSFKVELLKGVHNFTASTGDTFKIALLKAVSAGSGTFGAATTNYSDLSTDELGSGSGYTRLLTARPLCVTSQIPRGVLPRLLPPAR